MIYLIGGPGRSGKTTLARRLLENHGIPFFSLDYLMMGLHHGVPDLEIDPSDPEAEVEKRMWPVCRPMVVAMLENGEDYCVEGFCLTPERVSGLISVFPGDIRACFLGFCEIDTEAKLQHDLNFPTANPWLAGMPREGALAKLKIMKEASRSLRESCSDKGYAFFDTGDGFEMALSAAERSLTETPPAFNCLEK